MVYILKYQDQQHLRVTQSDFAGMFQESWDDFGSGCFVSGLQLGSQLCENFRFFKCLWEKLASS